MRRKRLALALAIASTLGAASLTNGSLGSLTGSTGQQNGDDAALETLDLAQLGTPAAISIDSFYLGNEAGHTDGLKLDESFLVGGSASDFTTGQPDDFVFPTYVGSIGVDDDAYASFDLCTDGGASLGSFGGCAYDDAPGLSEQVNFGIAGYRSLGFATPNDVVSETFAMSDPLSLLPPSIGTSSSSWGLFEDGPGTQNDGNHHDNTTIAGPDPVPVPEPTTISLLGLGLLGLAAARRRRSK